MNSILNQVTKGSVIIYSGGGGGKGGWKILVASRENLPDALIRLCNILTGPPPS